MTDNLVSFDEVDTEHQISALQAGLPRVVLEGSTDVRLFAAWFLHLSDGVEFVEADDVIRGGGCSAVGAAVAHSISQDGVPAIGIVDRDHLFRGKDWTNLFTVDDTIFASVQTPDVITTSLWEVEAYLLRPELLGDWVELRAREQPVPAAFAAGAVDAAVEECEALLDMSPALAAAHAAETAVPDGWGLGVSCSDLVAACEANHAAELAAQAAIASQVKAMVAEIRRNAPTTPADRLSYLLRYVNTKRLLQRLKTRLCLHPNSHWVLTKVMSYRTLKPEELERVVVAHWEKYAA